MKTQTSTATPAITAETPMSTCELCDTDFDEFEILDHIDRDHPDALSDAA